MRQTLVEGAIVTVASAFILFVVGSGLSCGSKYGCVEAGFSWKLSTDVELVIPGALLECVLSEGSDLLEARGVSEPPFLLELL
jgi:hypothetical protein